MMNRGWSRVRPTRVGDRSDDISLEMERFRETPFHISGTARRLALWLRPAGGQTAPELGCLRHTHSIAPHNSTNESRNDEEAKNGQNRKQPSPPVFRPRSRIVDHRVMEGHQVLISAHTSQTKQHKVLRTHSRRPESEPPQSPGSIMLPDLVLGIS